MQEGEGNISESKGKGRIGSEGITLKFYFMHHSCLCMVAAPVVISQSHSRW